MRAWASTLLLSALFGCTSAPPSTESEEAASGAEAPVGTPPTEDAPGDAIAEIEAQVPAEDDGVHGWSVKGTHAEVSRLLAESLEQVVELMPSEEALRASRARALSALERAATSARSGAAEATGSENAVLARYARALSAIEVEGSAVAVPSLAGTASADPREVAAALADAHIRIVLPEALERMDHDRLATTLRDLEPIGDLEDPGSEAQLAGYVSALVGVAREVGEPPLREIWEPSLANALWLAYRGAMIALFGAPEGDATAVAPETSAGWCLYARFLAFQSLSEVHESTYWSGMEIMSQLQVVEELEAGEEWDGDGPPPELTSEELRELDAIYDVTSDATGRLRVWAVDGPPARLERALEELAPELLELGAVMVSIDWPRTLGYALRRARAAVELCPASPVSEATAVQ